MAIINIQTDINRVENLLKDGKFDLCKDHIKDFQPFYIARIRARLNPIEQATFDNNIFL